jgi:hypothetical protein
VFPGVGGYTPPESDPDPDEHEAVDETAAWRYAAFRAIGYDIGTSVTLAQSWADWHDVSRAVGRGCPLALAADIFT